MSGISASLGRTVKTNIVLYSTDNKGRDGYITYNNGGFWKDNIKPIKMKANFPRTINTTFHSLIHQAAPFNYYSDGRGRDTYVIKNNAGLVKEFNPLANRQVLAKYLRKDIVFSSDNKKRKKRIFLTYDDRRNFLKDREIQTNVVRRLYDNCLDKFREKMKSVSPANKESEKNLRISTINYNFPFEYNENNLYKPTNNNYYGDKIENNKNEEKNMMHKKMKRKILKFNMNKTSNNFYNLKLNRQKAFSGDLKINNTINNKLNNYLTVSNMIKNKDLKNTITPGTPGTIENWNPILTKYNNSIQNYTMKNVHTTNCNLNKGLYKYFRDKELSNLKLNEVEKNSVKNNDNDTDINNTTNNNNNDDSLKLEVYKLRPKSYRTLFQKTQILNNYKPFLIDDFQEYSDCDQ